MGIYIDNQGMHFVKMYFYSILLNTNVFHLYSQPSSGCRKDY